MAVTFTPSGTASAGGVQQSYALVHAALLEGQLSDIRNNTIGTYVNETGSVIPFGNVVAFNQAGTVANSARTIGSGTAIVAGVNVLTYVDETALDANSRPGVKNQQVLNVANEGAVAVLCSWFASLLPPPCACFTAQLACNTPVNSVCRFAGQNCRLSNARYLSSSHWLWLWRLWS
jgi:hypothetical protein